MTRAQESRHVARAAFTAALRRRGWKPDGFMGYWEAPSGLHVSEENWPTHRSALAGMLREESQYVARKEDR